MCGRVTYQRFSPRSAARCATLSVRGPTVGGGLTIPKCALSYVRASDTVSRMQRERIDKLLVDRKLAPSRTRAQALVMAGVVLVNEQLINKPSEMFALDANIRIKGFDDPASRYVSRGGLKLEAALREFHIDVGELTCLDVGASTGGFTNCLLQHGASRVVAVDVGHNQLDWRLRNDSRVE